MSRPGGRVPSRGPWLVAFLFAIALALFLLVGPGGPKPPTLDGGAVVAERDDESAVLRGAARAADAAPPPAPAVDAVPVETAESEDAVWRVHGRVRSPAGDPISGASLRLTLYRGALDIPLAAQETLADAAGHYAFLVPLSWLRTALTDRTTSCRVEAMAPGHGRAATGLRGVPPGAEPETVATDLVLEPSATIRGRVVHADGTPAARADLLVMEGREIRGEAVADASGHYTLHPGVCPPGRRLWVAAFANGGRSLGSTFSLEGTATHEHPDLVIEASPWTLEGSVVLADGIPVRGLQVWARSLEDMQSTLIVPWSGEEVAELAEPHAETDARGVFRMAVHGPGRHEITALSHPLPARIVAWAGDEGLRLSVALHVLRVQALHAAGAPLPGTEIRVRTWAAAEIPQVEARLGEGLEPDDILRPPSTHAGGDVTGRDGWGRLFVAPGSLCLVRVRYDRDAPWSPSRLVRTEADRWETEVTFVVGGD